MTMRRASGWVFMPTIDASDGHGDRFALIDESNELLVMLADPRSANDLPAALRALRDRCHRQFRCDEAVMIEARRPDLIEHAADHRRIERCLDAACGLIEQPDITAQRRRHVIISVRSALASHLLNFDLLQGRAALPRGGELLPC